MSTTIDQRVVEMRFDNKHFESNVQTTMSTLDKLKQKLNLSGSAKGLEGISSAAKKVDMSGLSTGIDTINTKFSALQVMGVTALANITNSAVNAGKRMVSALIIDPIKTGFQEYETQINSIQTILANTQKEGTNVKIVNEALDELNAYADKTIYNFTEMTRNIGTFTAAGVELQTSVDAIQGIANLAAVSGSTSQQASTAMYQLSQALASGTVKLMDWNSVVNAGMGGQVFQDALKETSELLGTGAEAAIKAEGSFRDSLSTGWLTAEVLTETLKKFTTSGANEYVAKYTGLSEEAVKAALKEAEVRYGEADAIEYASKALAEKSGKNAKEIKDILQFAKTAEDAATEVKTFTQLWDTLKEAVQSGWGQTWRLIVGDFEQAKNLLSPLSEKITGFIDKMSKARNDLLNNAFTKNFSKLGDKISGLLKPAKQAIDTVKEVKSTISDLGGIVDDVILGKFGNGKERFDALTKAGENYYRIQNKVNEKLGYSFRYTDEQINAQDKLLGKQKESTKSKSEESKETAKLTDEEKKRIKTLAAMSDEQLRSKGYSEEQIAAFKELRNTADKLGIPLNKFIDNLDEINGRWLLLNSFKNIGTAISKVFSSIGQAWKEIFDPINSDQIFNVIAAFHKFTASLIMNKDAADDLKRTFKGLFAIIDIIRTVAGGGLKIAFKVLSKILGAFDTNVLDLTANVGDAIVKFRDWLFENNKIVKAFDKIIDKIPGAIKVVKEWINAFLELPIIQKAIDNIKDGFDKFKEIGKNVIEGLRNGLNDGIGSIPDMLLELGRKMLSTICDVLGIESPSWKMFEIGKNFILGLYNGIKEILSKLWDLLKSIGSKMLDIFEKIDWNKIFAIGISIAMVATVYKFAKAFETLVGVLDSFAGIFDGVKNVLNSTSKVLNSFALNIKAKALKDIAISIAILVGAIVLLTFFKPEDLIKAGIVVGVLAAVLLGLAIATDKMASSSITIGRNGASANNLKAGLLAIGGALLLMAVTVKIIGSLNPEQAEQGFKGLAKLITSLIIVFAAYSLLNKSGRAANINKVGTMFLKLSISLLILVAVVKLVGTLSENEIIKGTMFLGGFIAFLTLFMLISKIGNDLTIHAIGKSILQISIALLILVAVVKLAGKLDYSDMIKCAVFMGGFLAFLTLFVLISKIGGKEIPKIGRTLLAISTSLLILVAVVKLVGMLDYSEMAKGGIFVAGFLAFLTLFVLISKIGTGEITKSAATILALSIAVGILAGVSIILGLIDLTVLAKGITAVGILGAIMSLMIVATRGANECKGNLIVMSVAIGVMAAAVAALSLIDTKSLITSVLSLSILMGMFALMTKVAGSVEASKGSIGALISIVGVILVLTGVIYLLSKVDAKTVLPNVIALSILLVAMSEALLVLKATSSMTGSALKGVISLTAMAFPLLAFVYVLSKMNKVQNAAKNVLTLVILAGALTLLLIPLTIIGHFIGFAILGVISLTAMALPLFAFVHVLSKMNGVSDATENVKALIIMAGALTLMLIPLTIIGSFVLSALGGVLALTAMTIPLLAFVYVLSKMNKIKNATTNANLLIDLMTAMGNVLFKIALVAPLAVIGVGAMAGLTGLMVVIGALAVGIGALMNNKILNIQKFLDTGIPILEQLAHGIGSMLGNFVAGFSEAVMQLLPKLGECLSEFMEKVTPFIDGVKMVDESVLVGVGILVAAILALTYADFISVIGQFISFGQSYKDLGKSLTDFALAIIPFIDMIKDLEEKDIKGIDVISDAVMKLAEAELFTTITSLIQKIPGTSDFEDFGKRLVALGRCLKIMAVSINGVDTEAVGNVADATKKLAEAEAALPRQDGWLQDKIGTKDLGDFGGRIAVLGKCIKTMADAIVGVDTEAIKKVADATKSLAEAEAALPRQDGWLQDAIGEQDIGSFGKRIKKLGECLKEMAGTINGVDMDVIENVSDAISDLVKLEGKLPRQDGWLQDAIGEQDIGDFGKRIKKLGETITDFSENTTVDQGVIDQAVMAGDTVNSLQKALPKEGWFDGKMNLDEFSKYIKNFGKALKSFGDTVSDIDMNAMGSSISAAYRIKNLINDLSGIDTSGVKDFTGIGKGGVGVSGGAVDKIAKAISGYCEEISDINTSKLDASVTAALKLKNLISGLVGLDPSGVDNFKISSIGKKIKGYYDEVSGIKSNTITNTVNAAIKLKDLISSLAEIDTSGIIKFKSAPDVGSAIKSYASSVNDINLVSLLASIAVGNKLAKFVTSLSGMNTSGVNLFKTAIDNLSKTNVNGFIKTFNSASSKLSSTGSNMMDSIAKGMKNKQGTLSSTSNAIISSVLKNITSKTNTFVSVGRAMITNIVKGINDIKSRISSSLLSLIRSAISDTRDYYDSFYSAGSYLVSGFANGISANAYKATARAVAMANAAKKAVKDALDINSPSKVFYKLGGFTGLGFVNALDDYADKSYSAAYNIGDYARTGLSKAISKVNSIINSDLDSQPTIRPVLDLSDVESGVGTIGNMFDRRLSIGAVADINAISSMMNQRNQNGVNSDVVSAINKLRKDLGNTRGGDTYNVNGVTYDDGSNISNAVKSIVRAARIERRT